MNKISQTRHETLLEGTFNNIKNLITWNKEEKLS